MLTADTRQQLVALPLRRHAVIATAAPRRYPGALLMSIDVPTQGLPKADGGRLRGDAAVRRRPGQTPGLGNGQLPPGFLPLTAANGLVAQVVGYTDRAATASPAQSG